MSFKTDLQSNNTDLQAILDAVNNLPKAGSGDHVSINVSFSNHTSGSYYYCNANGEFIESIDEGIIEAKGGIIISKHSSRDISGGAEYYINSITNFYIFNSNNATLVLAGNITEDEIPI